MSKKYFKAYGSLYGDDPRLTAIKRRSFVKRKISKPDEHDLEETQPQQTEMPLKNKY